MILYLDTETTGIPDTHVPPSHPAQPNLVQIGMILVDADGTERASFSAIVRPEGYRIPAVATAVHVITTEQAINYGLPLRLVVPAIAYFLRAAEGVVCHNFPFDERIVNTAFARFKDGFPTPWPFVRACTMEMAEPILKLPATVRMKAAGYGDKFKKPSLEECVRYFFRRAPTKAHDALGDARDCLAVHQRLLAGGKRDPWYRGWI